MLRIYNVEAANEVVAELPRGHHIIGRGPLLKCLDKRVSRGHASVEVSDGPPFAATFTATHINPCFLMPANSKTVTILPKDASTALYHGDKFGLLPDMFWYRIEVVASEQATKRPLSDADDESSKRAKIDEGDELNESNDTNNDVAPETSVAAAGDDDDLTPNGLDEMEEPEPEPTGDNAAVIENANSLVDGIDDSASLHSASLDEYTSNVTQTAEEKFAIPAAAEDKAGSTSADKAEDSDKKDTKNEDSTDPGNSSDQPAQGRRREKCWYGANCYRRNPAHRVDFTHPGDSDFESDPDDDRPTCSYGAMCYRRNPGHRQNYKHPARAPPSANGRPKRQTRPRHVEDNDNGEPDEYDLDDPFLADDSSDEFSVGSGDDDSDWEDSQNVEENSEEMRQLVKEAKRFQRRK